MVLYGFVWFFLVLSGLIWFSYVYGLFNGVIWLNWVLSAFVYGLILMVLFHVLHGLVYFISFFIGDHHEIMNGSQEITLVAGRVLCMEIFGADVDWSPNGWLLG